MKKRLFGQFSNWWKADWESKGDVEDMSCCMFHINN